MTWFRFRMVMLVIAVGIAASHGCINVNVVSRQGWRARRSRSNQLMRTTAVPHLFVHHTASGECNSPASCVKMVKGIQNFHMNNRGWDDIGYSFLIGGDGRLYTGRGWRRVGAHTFGFNSKSIGVALIGNFSNKRPSQKMLNTLKNFIQCARDQGHVTTNFKIHGHRDGGCTDCPGTQLYNIIKTWPRFQRGRLPGFKCGGK